MRLFLAILALSGALLAACDDGSSPAQTSDVTDVAADVPATGFDPYTLVPALALEADPDKVCPDGYGDGGLAAGQHAMYLAAGQQRSFYLVLPDAEAFTGPRPLLVLFNGTGGTGVGFYEGNNIEAYVERGFVVLAPDSVANGTLWPVWDAMRMAEDEVLPNADLELLDSLIGCLGTHHAIDANRIFLTGMSAGGIMANRVLRNRSELFAGGMIGSGVYDLTAAEPAPELEPMAIIVSWGGVNDAWGGDSDDPTVAVPEINFVEQASVASLAYEATPGVHQIACHGDDLGHAYLKTIAGWAAEFFLMHPKGASEHENYTFAPPTAFDETVTCTEEAFLYESSVTVECDEAADTMGGGCLDYCQFAADCVVENGTVAGPLGPQMADLGFSGEGYTECGGCIDTCLADLASGGDEDTDVLACWSEARANNTCSAGVSGALPFILTVNACCLEAMDSAICARMCTTVMSSDIAADFFKDTCAPWAPPEEAEEAEEPEEPGKG
jgi:predicted esterase